MPFIQTKTSLKSGRGMLLCALLVPTAIVLTAFGFGRGKTNRPIATTEPAELADTSTMLFQGASSASLDAEHITLRSTGSEPNEIARPAGRFLLAIDNVTGMGEMSFRLINQSGALVRDYPANGRFRLRQIVDLPAGRYALAEIKQFCNPSGSLLGRGALLRSHQILLVWPPSIMKHPPVANCD